MQTSGLVAPTQKISDDAPYPTSGPSSIPPQNYTPSSVPPQNNYVSGPTSVPPQNNYASSPPASVPPQNNYAPPASIPPQNNAFGGYAQNNPASIPPGASAPPRAATAPPRAQSVAPAPNQASSQPRPRTNGVPSVSRRQTPAFSDPSITPPPRRWGLIITVLLVDLALAGAGVYLLTQGLA